MSGLLAPYRVIDLTDHRGQLAGMVLGDMGADIVKVEPPGGSVARSLGPRLAHADATESSLEFFAFNRNKRSICLDPDSPADRAALARLLGGADIVLDSGPDGALATFGIDQAALVELQPRVVHAVCSPFGLGGPAQDRLATDLTLAALGGSVALQGSPDRAPVRVTVPQVWRHAGAELAAAALIAHGRMQVTGEAQFVDLSAQCSVTWTTMNAMDAWAVQGFDFERQGSVVQMGTTEIDPVFACADGYLIAMPVGEVVEPLLGHLLGLEIVDPRWLEEDWTTWSMRSRMDEPILVSREEVRDALVQFFPHHTKAELFAMCLELGVTLAPVNTVADLLEFEQLKSREAWWPTELPDGSHVRAAGHFAQTQPANRLERRAPRLDEHGEELRAEPPRAPADVDIRDNGTDRPFAGLKVLDLTWVIAGPASVRYLSDHGAHVIKVESALRPDGLRRLGPVRGDIAESWNVSHFYGEFNAGKQNIRLNLKDPRAMAVLKKLIAWADVLVENWAPGATARAGIDYESNRKLNPDLIMLSTSLMGQTGPAAGVAGYGYHAGGMAGYYEVTGWPDAPPHGPWMAYTDVIAPHFIAALVTAALDHRRRTGAGQHIDAAQFEMALHFLAPEILDVQANGYCATRLGNRATDAAPQGLYPCSGDDQWCAIAVETDAQWRALAEVIEADDWARDARLATSAGRLADHDAIDARLADWTRERDRYAVMETLLAAGVPAGAMQRSSDLAADPQYAHRGFHKVHVHAEMGEVPYAGNQFNIAGYTAGPFGPAPLFGEHNESVLRDELGLPEDEIQALLGSEAME
ncbi:MAG: CoA transferase [Pseudomonadota bacterium]